MRGCFGSPLALLAFASSLVSVGGVGDLQRDRLCPEYRRQMYIGITTLSRLCSQRGTSVALLVQGAGKVNQVLIELTQFQHNSR